MVGMQTVVRLRAAGTVNRGKDDRGKAGSLDFQDTRVFIEGNVRVPMIEPVTFISCG